MKANIQQEKQKSEYDVSIIRPQMMTHYRDFQALIDEAEGKS